MRLNDTEKLASVLDEIKRRLGLLENSQRSAVAILTADPANPRSGDVWLRSDTNQFCARIGTSTKRVTLT